MLTVLERLHTAMNQHDLEAMLECFDPEYRSEQPLHPNRGFGGKEQVRKNWSRTLDSFPDFEAQLLGHASSGGTVWSEWRWSATGLNMMGVTLLGVREDASFGVGCTWSRSKKTVRISTNPCGALPKGVSEQDRSARCKQPRKEDTDDTGSRRHGGRRWNDHTRVVGTRP